MEQLNPTKQELPFRRFASRNHSKPRPLSPILAGDCGQRPLGQLYGGGILPPGFEHLESLRRQEPSSKQTLLTSPHVHQSLALDPIISF